MFFDLSILKRHTKTVHGGQKDTKYEKFVTINKEIISPIECKSNSHTIRCNHVNKTGRQ